MAAMNTEKDLNPITLVSKDNISFKVDMDVCNKFATIRTMFEDIGQENIDDEAVPLPNVRGNILEKVIKWATYHKDDPEDVPGADDDDLREKRTDDISEWDKGFLQNFDQHILFELMLAANYLDIKGLMDLLCKTVANMIKGKSPEEIRTTFNIKNDFTPEEEQLIHRENEWVEDK